MKNEKNYIANEAFHWNKTLSTNLFFQRSGVPFYSKQDCQKSIYSGGNSRVTSSGIVPSKINRLSHENFDIIFYLVKYQKVNFPAAISDVHPKLEESNG